MGNNPTRSQKLQNIFLDYHFLSDLTCHPSNIYGFIFVENNGHTFAIKQLPISICGKKHVSDQQCTKNDYLLGQFINKCNSLNHESFLKLLDCKQCDQNIYLLYQWPIYTAQSFYRINQSQQDRTSLQLKITQQCLSAYRSYKYKMQKLWPERSHNFRFSLQCIRIFTVNSRQRKNFTIKIIPPQALFVNGENKHLNLLCGLSQTLLSIFYPNYKFEQSTLNKNKIYSFLKELQKKQCTKSNLDEAINKLTLLQRSVSNNQTNNHQNYMPSQLYNVKIGNIAQSQFPPPKIYYPQRNLEPILHGKPISNKQHKKNEYTPQYPPKNLSTPDTHHKRNLSNNIKQEQENWQNNSNSKIRKQSQIIQITTSQINKPIVQNRFQPNVNIVDQQRIYNITANSKVCYRNQNNEQKMQPPFMQTSQIYSTQTFSKLKIDEPQYKVSSKLNPTKEGIKFDATHVKPCISYTYTSQSKSVEKPSKNTVDKVTINAHKEVTKHKHIRQYSTGQLIPSNNFNNKQQKVCITPKNNPSHPIFCKDNENSRIQPKFIPKTLHQIHSRPQQSKQKSQKKQQRRHQTEHNQIQIVQIAVDYKQQLILQWFGMFEKLPRNHIHLNHKLGVPALNITSHTKADLQDTTAYDRLQITNSDNTTKTAQISSREKKKKQISFASEHLLFEPDTQANTIIKNRRHQSENQDLNFCEPNSKNIKNGQNNNYRSSERQSMDLLLSKDSYDEDNDLVGNYTGQYHPTLTNMRHGNGRFDFQSSGSYQGQFSYNKMHGYGKLFYPSGRLAYEGYWHHNTFHGYGKMFNQFPEYIEKFNYRNFNQIQLLPIQGQPEIQSNGYWKVFEGSMKNDMKDGHGVWILENGQKFQGQFKADCVHGEGVFHGKQGVIEGKWRNNLLVQIYQIKRQQDK